MCLLFLSVTSDPKDPDDYLIILVNTRDEFFNRPSRYCHFWEKTPDIVGGMDFEMGKEGGTWLAMHSSGKIASILNLLKPLHEITGGKESRGFLIERYLKSKLDGPSFLRTLQSESYNYDDFLLVTLDVRPSLGKVTAAYYTNNEDMSPVTLRPGVYVFGNSAPHSPWKKLDAAKEKFRSILSQHRKKSKKELLINELFKMLQDDTPHYPDEQLQKDGEGRGDISLKHLSSIFVKDTDYYYGSRTHTVILIDTHGNVDYVEKTMQEPIDFSVDVSWITTHLQFIIQEPSRLISRL